MPKSAKPVFISYHRKSAGDAALALRDRLGKDRVFIDVNDIPDGAQFPPAMADALLDARVVVAFADPSYFRSQFCVAEWRLAMSPRVDHPGQIVIALSENAGSELLTQLPSSIRNVSWPKFTDTARLADLVEQCLVKSPSTIRELDPDRTARIYKQVLSGLIVPAPQPLGKIPAYPQPLPGSLHDRFVGRAADLHNLHAALQQGHSAALTGSLQGAAGFGKTRLAVEYLHRYGPVHYPGGLFWLNAATETSAA